jgi:hypothetical protein
MENAGPDLILQGLLWYHSQPDSVAVFARIQPKEITKEPRFPSGFN